MTVRTITVEPMTPTLRKLHGLQGDPNRLAVVLAGQLGKVINILCTTDDESHAYEAAHRQARALSADVVTGHSFRPTVVGKDVAALVLADPANQPTETPAQLAALASMLDEATLDAVRFAEVADSSDPHSGMIVDEVTPAMVSLMLVQIVPGQVVYRLNKTGERLCAVLNDTSEDRLMLGGE